MIRRIAMAVCGLVLMAGAALAQVNEAIEDVIGTQLQAFNDRDVNLAFSFASPMIKRIFRNPGNFGLMVENGYPMVWDNADVRFVGLREEAGTFVQTVQMKDASGVIHTLEYLMIETSEGWQINGVQLVETDLAA